MLIKSSCLYMLFNNTLNSRKYNVELGYACSKLMFYDPWNSTKMTTFGIMANRRQPKSKVVSKLHRLRQPYR